MDIPAGIQYRAALIITVVSLAAVSCPAAAVQWSWQKETVDSGTTIFTETTSIAVDSHGEPHITYYDYAGGNLGYTWKTGSGTWMRRTIDSTGDVGTASSLELSPGLDRAMISYHDQSGNQLKYARQYPDGSWGWIALDDGGSSTSLATDSDGHPHIGYPGNDGTMKYAYWESPVWDIDVVDAGGVASGAAIALDSSGGPSVAYVKDGTSVKYARIECFPLPPPLPEACLFVPRTVDSGAFSGQDVSLAVDADGVPHISYWEMDSSELRYATKDDGVWQVTPVDSIPPGPAGTSIAVNSAGYPAVSYQDSVPMDLVFAWKDKAGWHTMTIDQKGYTGAFSSLAFDSSGNAHISYIDQTKKILKYAKGTRVLPLPGYPLSPSDPDLDGIFEDLNGNGRLDFADLVLYFNRMEWITDNEPIAAFDLNGNGRIDFADVVALFSKI